MVRRLAKYTRLTSITTAYFLVLNLLRKNQRLFPFQEPNKLLTEGSH